MELRRTMLAAVTGAAALLGTLTRAEDAKPDAPKPEVKKEEPPPAAPKKPQSMEEAIASIPIEALEDGGVLLESGPIKVQYTTAEPMEKAAWMAHKKRDPKWDFAPGEQTALRKQIGVKLLANAVIEQYAADKKLTAPEEKYKDVFGKFKLAKEQRGGYAKFLTDSGLNDDDFQRFLHASVAIEQEMSQSVTADDVKKYYDEHQDEIGLRRASDIMFTYTGANGAPATTKRTKEEAKHLADELLKKLKSSPDADFPILVKDMSDGPSARDGGDLGFVPKKGTIESIADAVYKIQKVGEYSDVVESPFGFHVIKLTQVREENDIANEIKDRITSERFGAEMQKLMESAIAKAKFNKKLM